jgi:hypothetical protein
VEIGRQSIARAATPRAPMRRGNGATKSRRARQSRRSADGDGPGRVRLAPLTQRAHVLGIAAARGDRSPQSGNAKQGIRRAVCRRAPSRRAVPRGA